MSCRCLSDHTQRCTRCTHPILTLPVCIRQHTSAYASILFVLAFATHAVLTATTYIYSYLVYSSIYVCIPAAPSRKYVCIPAAASGSIFICMYRSGGYGVFEVCIPAAPSPRTPPPASTLAQTPCQMKMKRLCRPRTRTVPSPKDRGLSTFSPPPSHELKSDGFVQKRGCCP